MTVQVSHAQGQLLGRVRPGVVTPVQLFKASDLRTEITLLLIAQAPLGGNNTADIVIFHDDTGNDVYDGTTAIAAFTYDKTTAGGFVTGVFQAQHPGSGIMLSANASIGVQSNRVDETVFTCYGITETLAERVRGLGQ